MNKLIIILFLTFFGVVKAQNELKVGEKAPEIVFVKSFPNEYSIPSNKTIVLDFWATWCGPCIASLIEHNHLVEKYSKEIEFIAITDNTSRNVDGFIKSKNFKNKFIIDQDTTSFNNYGVKGIPYLFVIGKDRIIKWAGHSRQLKENDLKEILGQEVTDNQPMKNLPKRQNIDEDKLNSLDKYVLTIKNKELLNKSRSILVGKIDDTGKGNYSNAPEWEGNLTVINYDLNKLVKRTQSYFSDRKLVCDKESKNGYDFINVPFNDFEVMNEFLLKNYGIHFKKE